jgi:hypothetical protein
MTDKNTEQEASTGREASDLDVLVMLQKSVKTLREMKDVQCSDGNWNYDQYMHGMANGMIFALSLFDDKAPEYIEAPEQWLKDLPDSELKP